MPQPHTNIEEFLARHSQSNFRHKDELFSLLASDAAACEANSSIASCARLLKIYRRRADLLRRYETPHAQQLHDDVLALWVRLLLLPMNIVSLDVFIIIQLKLRGLRKHWDWPHSWLRVCEGQTLDGRR